MTSTAFQKFLTLPRVTTLLQLSKVPDDPYNDLLSLPTTFDQLPDYIHVLTRSSATQNLHEDLHTELMDEGSGTYYEVLQKMSEHLTSYKDESGTSYPYGHSYIYNNGGLLTDKRGYKALSIPVTDTDDKNEDVMSQMQLIFKL